MGNKIQSKVRRATLTVEHCTAQAGFTLVELLVSMLLTSIIMLAIYSVYRVQTHSAKVQESRLEAQEYARSVIDMMVREIRNAAYNPLTISDIAVGTGCGALGNGAPGVLTATATSIQFTYDFENTAGTVSTPDGKCDGPDEKITYTYTTGCAPGLGDITRTAGAGSAQTLTNCNVPTTNGFNLQYFKQDGTPATGLTDIQRVSISITVQSLKPDTEFGGQLTATMTSNADLRNRGLPS